MFVFTDDQKVNWCRNKGKHGLRRIRKMTGLIDGSGQLWWIIENWWRDHSESPQNKHNNSSNHHHCHCHPIIIIVVIIAIVIRRGGMVG